MSGDERGFPLFIVGCGRSGTTLLRLMLNAHPDLAIPPEAQFIDRLAARRDRYVRADRTFETERFLTDLLEDERFKEWGIPASVVRDRVHPGDGFAGVVGAAFEAYASEQGKRRWGDKTPDHVRHIPFLADLWPGGRFIHLIRDGRDVAGSLAATPFGPDGLQARARYWAKRVREGRRAGATLGPSRYLEVRYEELVADPSKELRRLCAFAELAFDPGMLAHHQRSAGAIPPSEMGHQAGALQPIRTDTRNWRVDMTPREVASFEAAEGRLLGELGYPLVGAAAPGAWLRARAVEMRERVDLRRRIRRALGRTKGSP